MSKTTLLWLVLTLTGTGCAAFETVLGNLTSPAGPGPEQIGSVVDTALTGTPLQDMGIGAGVTGLIGFLGSFLLEKRKRKQRTGELFQRLEKVERNGGGQPSSPSPPPPG